MATVTLAFVPSVGVSDEASGVVNGEQPADFERFDGRACRADHSRVVAAND